MTDDRDWILVTGASGFIARALTRRLGHCYRIRGYDLHPTADGVDDFVQGDVLDTDRLAAALRGCVGVVHLASKLGVANAQADEIGTAGSIVGGAESLRECLIANPVPVVVAASSSEVYGDGHGRPMREAQVPTPMTAYGRAKVRMERVLSATPTDTSFAFVRFFNVYGPHQRDDFVVPRFCRAALDDEPLLVHGNGEQTRTFIYVDDAARALELMVSRHLGRPADRAVYNVSSREPVTITDLARTVIRQTGSRSEVVYIPFDRYETRDPRQEIMSRIPDASVSAAALGFEAHYALDAGIRATCSSIKTGASA